MRRFILSLTLVVAIVLSAAVAWAAEPGTPRLASAAATCTGASATPLAAFLAGTTPLRKGSSGAAVWELQAFLRLQGYSVGAIDGKYGNLTSQAVRAFQHDHGLAEDGVAGTATRAAIRTMTQQAGFASLASPTGKVLRPGATGAEVRELQLWLKAAGHDPGVLDGKYGAKTAAAVKAFQQAHSPLVADGKVGAATRAKLAWALGLTWPGTCTS
jgi:peptidoglycan hydrolase-like protein with peptidoglycan-binding domain